MPTLGGSVLFRLTIPLQPAGSGIKRTVVQAVAGQTTRDAVAATLDQQNLGIDQVELRLDASRGVIGWDTPVSVINGKDLILKLL